jgi:hypothetical protein
MGTLNDYREVIKALLDEHKVMANQQKDKYDLESHTIFDEANDRYMLFRTGWWGKKRVHTATLYVRLEQGKIWIEEDMTEDGLAPELLAAGVPKEDIVLAFHHPEVWPFTEFAVA